MNKKERFNTAVNYLKERGLVHTQKDVASMMGTTSPNVSSALKGVESVLTDNFLRRFYVAFEQVFNEAWILSGEGEMLKSTPPAENLSMSRLLSLLEASHETIRKRDEQIDRLITLLEKETERTEFINKSAV